MFSFRRRTEASSILVVSLWVISILSAFAISAGYQVRQKITLADRLNYRAWLYGLAETGVSKAIEKLKEDKIEDGFDTHYDMGANEAFRFQDKEVAGGGSFLVAYEQRDLIEGTSELRFGLIDEERKLNLNTVDAQVMSRFLQLLEVEEDTANEIANGIVDWRDSDSFLTHPNYGAEDDYYEDLKFSYGAKDQPFETFQELLLVRGMTPDIFNRMRDYVTVFGSGAINVNTAPREVLIALGLDESLVRKIIDFRKGADSKEGTGDDNYCSSAGNITSDISSIKELSSSEMAALSNLVAKGSLGVSATYFMIKSRGLLKQRELAIDIESIVDRNGKVVLWSGGIPRKMTNLDIQAITLVENSNGGAIAS